MKPSEKPFVFFVYGPTAVGKTDFAIDVAKEVSAEVINGDSAQFYTPFGVGTAKPDWKNEPVAHHLFDIINEPKNFSVYEYRNLLLQTVDDIWSRGKLPIVVGGSGFYLKSIFFPPYVPSQNDKDGLQQKETDQSESLWEQLNRIDPERALCINKGDTYRLERALFLWRKTGKKPSELIPVYDPPVRFLMLYLSRDKDELYDRINRRTALMVKDGWLQEIEELSSTEWEPFLYQKKFIGYDALFDYVGGDKTEDSLHKAIEIIRQRTRSYAKRQKTFWSSMHRQLNEAAKNKTDESDCQKDEAISINLTLSDRDLYIKRISERLRGCVK